MLLLQIVKPFTLNMLDERIMLNILANPVQGCFVSYHMLIVVRLPD